MTVKFDIGKVLPFVKQSFKFIKAIYKKICHLSENVIPSLVDDFVLYGY